MKNICLILFVFLGLTGYSQQQTYKVYFGNITNDQKVTKAELLKVDSVTFSTGNDDKMRTRIVSFKMTAILKGTEFLEELSSSPYVNVRMKALLKTVLPGDKIYIENIVIKGADGAAVKLDRIAIEVIK